MRKDVKYMLGLVDTNQDLEMTVGREGTIYDWSKGESFQVVLVYDASELGFVEILSISNNAYSSANCQGSRLRYVSSSDDKMHSVEIDSIQELGPKEKPVKGSKANALVFPTLGDVVGNDPLAQWKTFYSVLVSAIPGLEGSTDCAYQFSNPERSADWWSDTGQQQVVDIIDAKPASGGAFYMPGASQVSQNYYTFLNALQTEDPLIQKAIHRYEQAEADGELLMSLAGDLRRDFEDWKNGQGNPLAISIDHDTRVDQNWHLVAGGEINVNGFILSGKGDVLDQKFVDDKYNLAVSYEATKAYSMVRGRNWWNAGLITSYQRPNPDMFRKPYTPDTFFGPHNGLLNMIPTTVVVTFRVNIGLTISHTNYSEFKMDLEGQGEISVGPFKLNANARYVKTDVSTDAQTVTITYHGTNMNPTLFGVFSEVHTL